MIPDITILQTRLQNLRWLHILSALIVDDPVALRWYLETASQTDEDIARYSILKGNEQIFATKYKLYLPTEEELRNEIERQKQLFQIKQS